MTEDERERAWNRIYDDIRVRADQLIYARQREWSGVFSIDRMKLRNLIAKMALEEAIVAVRRFTESGSTE